MTMRLTYGTVGPLYPQDGVMYNWFQYHAGSMGQMESFRLRVSHHRTVQGGTRYSGLGTVG